MTGAAWLKAAGILAIAAVCIWILERPRCRYLY